MNSILLYLSLRSETSVHFSSHIPFHTTPQVLRLLPSLDSPLFSSQLAPYSPSPSPLPPALAPNMIPHLKRTFFDYTTPYSHHSLIAITLIDHLLWLFWVSYSIGIKSKQIICNFMHACTPVRIDSDSDSDSCSFTSLVCLPHHLFLEPLR